MTKHKCQCSFFDPYPTCANAITQEDMLCDACRDYKSSPGARAGTIHLARLGDSAPHETLFDQPVPALFR